jgi:hypothetical protein
LFNTGICRSETTSGATDGWRGLCLALPILAASFGVHPADAASLSQKDIQILGKALGFLEPAPTGNASIAIAFDGADAASKQDAEAIASYFGGQLKVGGATVSPVVKDVSQLSGGGFLAVIAAAGTKVEQVGAASKAMHVACVTADASAVQSGQCVMSVKSDPKVEILISRAAAAGANVQFGSAFLLMAHQL